MDDVASDGIRHAYAMATNAHSKSRHSWQLVARLVNSGQGADWTNEMSSLEPPVVP